MHKNKNSTASLLFGMLLSLLVFFFISGCSSIILPPGSDADKFIREHSGPLPIRERTIVDGFTILSDADTADLYHILDSVYSNYIGEKRVIFIGERHACAGSFVVLHRLLPYFIDRFGVTTYLSEKGAAEGFLLDTYLKNGDESIPKRLLEMVRSSAAYTEDQMESFRLLRKQYLALPEEKRFRFIGIDVGHALSAPVMAFHYMVEELPGDPPPPLDKAEELYRQYIAEGFPVFGDDRQNDITGLIEELDTALRPGSGLELYLSNYAEEARLIIDSALSAYEFYETAGESGYDTASPIREAAIMDHFTRLHALSENPEEEVYFGQWGGFHVHQLPLEKDKTIAGMINGPDGPFTGEVLSTMIFYNNCFYRDRKTDRTQPVRDLSGAYLGARITADYALVPLDLPDSPFHDAPYFIYGGEETEGVTTDYFQIGLLIQNAPAAETYGVR